MKRMVSMLTQEVVPAFGCTEPIALAFTAAKAVEELGTFPDALVVSCSGNIIKNAKSVVIPNSEGRRGIYYSLILGALVGNAQRELEVLEALTSADIEKADELMNSDFCKVTLAENVENLFIDVTAIKGNHRTRVVVQNKHTHITHIEKDGVTVFDEPLAAAQAADELLTFDDCYAFADTADLSEVQERLLQQFTYNMAIAEEGMTHDYGANIGKLIMEEATSLRDKARAYAAAGSDARMGGCSMPVMINCGSGNQGITISVPIWVYAEEHNIPMERRIKALALANLLALYIKQGIGRLSAYCAVVSAASAGAAGVAYLMGEPKAVVEATLSNALAGTSGVVCDGAKPSCAMKIALSVGNALLAYKMARTDNNFKSGEGLVKGTVDRTVATIGDVARVGMKETDIVILESMLEK